MIEPVEPYPATVIDTIALAEIELTSQLMIAASGSPRHLTEGEVDLILGVGTVA